MVRQSEGGAAQNIRQQENDFRPGGQKYHEQLLRRFMNAMMPTAKFKPKGVEWKKMGFQGENPVTDIRAGGLLAFETLEHFATYYTGGATRMVAEVTALYLTNKERFYPFSTAAVVLCTELCDLIGLSKRNRGVIPEDDLNSFLISSTSSPFLTLIETNDHGVAYNEMFSYIFVDFHCTFIQGRDYGYLDLQRVVSITMDKFKALISKHNTIEALRNAYLSSHTMIKSLLTKEGGEHKGWRHMRVTMKAKSMQNLRGTGGIVSAIAGKSLYVDAMTSAQEQSNNDISNADTIPAVARTQSKGYGLSYAERMQTRRPKAAFRKKVSLMSMPRSKSFIRNEINKLYIPKGGKGSQDKFADV